jgi:hypothetical protein
MLSVRLASAGSPGLQVAPVTGMPACVTPAWISSSIREQTHLPEELFCVPDASVLVQAAFKQHVNTARSSTAVQPSALSGAALHPPELHVAKSARAADGDPGAPELTVPGWTLAVWHPAGWSADRWGEDGTWLEPYDAASARTTLETLFRHYHRLDLGTSTSPRAVELSGSHGAHTTLRLSVLSCRVHELGTVSLV